MYMEPEIEAFTVQAILNAAVRITYLLIRGGRISEEQREIIKIAVQTQGKCSIPENNDAIKYAIDLMDMGFEYREQRVESMQMLFDFIEEYDLKIQL